MIKILDLVLNLVFLVSPFLKSMGTKRSRRRAAAKRMMRSWLRVAQARSLPITSIRFKSEVPTQLCTVGLNHQYLPGCPLPSCCPWFKKWNTAVRSLALVPGGRDGFRRGRAACNWLSIFSTLRRSMLACYGSCCVVTFSILGWCMLVGLVGLNCRRGLVVRS